MLKHLKAAAARVGERSRHQREYAALLEMGDHMLKDVGLEREDVRARLARRHFA
jgi:uncharacterized protein YjiS (DUF1127 family)